MSTIFARTQQSISKKVFSQQFLFAKRWESGQYLGYVTFFNEDRLNGMIAREDVPDNYFFTANDIRAVTIPRARKYQQVAFHGQSRQGRLFAKDITTPNGEPLVYSYQNLRLRRQERINALSSVNGWETARFRGIVRSFFSGSHGFIVPIEVGYADVYFTAQDLQTTGRETITEGAEVEFSVLPRENRQDRAVNVTRPGGGMITEGANARVRRQLGSMYKETDTEARIPAECAGDERCQGYVIGFNQDASHGYIMAFDDPTKSIFVSLDDCHIYGKRSLRRFQHVEFFPQQTSSGEIRAIHVTGPGRSILRFNSPNIFVSKSLANKHFDPSDTERHKGVVTRVDHEKKFFMIKPDEYGYANVFAAENSALRMNGGRLQPGVHVEFTVTEGIESGDGEKSVRAGVVTAAGGRPFCDPRGPYGRYLAKRFDLAKPQKDLPECPLKESGEKYNGWVSTFNGEAKKGTIEIEAPEGERYRKVLFELQNANLGDQVFDETKTIANGAEVTLEVRALPDDKKKFTRDGKEIESTLTQEAFNVTSTDFEFLRLKPKISAEERQRPQKKEL